MRSSIFGSVVGQGFVLASIGIVLGTIGGFFVGRSIRTQLFDVVLGLLPLILSQPQIVAAGNRLFGYQFLALQRRGLTTTISEGLRPPSASPSTAHPRRSNQPQLYWLQWLSHSWLCAVNFNPTLALGTTPIGHDVELTP